MNKQPANSERRDFLKTASGALGAAVATGFPAILSGQTVTNAIKVGLVGCGGRGGGAARQALTADDYTELAAVADIDQSQIDNCLRSLKRVSKIAGRVKVETGSGAAGNRASGRGERLQALGPGGNGRRAPPRHPRRVMKTTFTPPGKGLTHP